MEVSTYVTITKPRQIILQELEHQEGEEISLSDHALVEFDANDVEDHDEGDVLDLYNMLGTREQQSFLRDIEDQLKEEDKIVEEPKNLAEQAELELLLSFRGKYSLDELKRRLESPVFVTDMTQTGSCKWCFTSDTLSEFLDE